MCGQCMVTAATAVAGASGARAWLGSRRFTTLGPRRMRAVTGGLGALALVAAAIGFG